MRNLSNNQYDPGLIAKEVTDFNGQFVRTSDVRSIVPEYYSHFYIDYNLDNKPEKVTYLLGTSPEETSINFIDDVNSSLNNKYFVIYGTPNNKPYYIWYNVDNLGINPNIPNFTGIEVEIQKNDQKQVIALATKLVLNSFFKEEFTCNHIKDTLQIRTVKSAIANNSFDVNTGFTISTTLQGAETIVKTLNFAYDGNGNTIFENQTLVGLIFDVFSGKFVPNQAANIGNLTVNVATNGFNLTTPDSMQITGSLNGTSTTQKYGFVNNLKNQILATHDRNQEIIYADFGTKNQRIIQINYTSPTFPAIIARKTLTYVLEYGRYKRTNIIWSIE